MATAFIFTLVHTLKHDATVIVTHSKIEHCIQLESGGSKH